MHGGSAEAAFTLYRGLGVATNLSGEHASNITSGVDLSKISFLVGPRYTYNTARWTERWLGPKHASSVFGETLFGTVHAGNAVKSSANAFAMQVGGGVNVALAKGFGLQALQLNYIYTTLPNNGTNTQHDLRMGIGIAYHLQAN